MNNWSRSETADLAFSVDEAKQFLAGLDVRLADTDIALVRERSEGWAAGLQMASLSLRNSPDPARAAGRAELQRHSVAGYFLDEVLYRQPPEVVDWRPRRLDGGPGWVSHVLPCLPGRGRKSSPVRPCSHLCGCDPSHPRRCCARASKARPSFWRGRLARRLTWPIVLLPRPAGSESKPTISPLPPPGRSHCSLWRCTDLATAAELNERVLGTIVSGRPIFDYLTQLDRARIWAANGNLEEALASLPAARTALKSERSVLLAQADDLEARFRLGLGDRAGAGRAVERLPGDRRTVMVAIIALAQGRSREAAQTLTNAPVSGPTVRSDLELRLLRASIAVMETPERAAHLVREALALAERHGFVQTVLDNAPRLVDHLISASTSYVSTDNLRALVTAGLESRRLTRLSTARTTVAALVDPLTDAEIRVLEKLPQRLTYLDMASDLHLSLNTVKTHLRHSYMKLGVTSRSGAIKRATSLGLL